MAKILKIPAAKRAEIAGRQLRRAVIDQLIVIKKTGGPAAFDKAAGDLLIAVAAVITHESGAERLADLFNLIEVTQEIMRTEASMYNG